MQEADSVALAGGEDGFHFGAAEPVGRGGGADDVEDGVEAGEPVGTAGHGYRVAPGKIRVFFSAARRAHATAEVPESEGKSPEKRENRGWRRM
jgi:hypothetical protein